MVLIRVMIGPAGASRDPSGLDPAPVRRLIAPRVERHVEPPADREEDRRCDDHRCPPPERIIPSPGAIPFDRYLEQRNREDAVEFSLGKGCPPPVEPARPRPPETPERGELTADDDRSRARNGPGRWPRLGDVSPVEEKVVRQRLETVYGVSAAPGGARGGRVDLVG